MMKLLSCHYCYHCFFCCVLCRFVVLLFRMCVAIVLVRRSKIFSSDQISGKNVQRSAQTRQNLKIYFSFVVNFYSQSCHVIFFFVSFLSSSLLLLQTKEKRNPLLLLMLGKFSHIACVYMYSCCMLIFVVLCQRVFYHYSIYHARFHSSVCTTKKKTFF